MPIPNTPPPRIVMFEPFADCEPMQVFPTGLREQASANRESAARLLQKAFELEAMAAEAELAGTPWRRS
jgi:hypothetical protein